MERSRILETHGREALMENMLHAYREDESLAAEGR
jgi:hypothetical protein